MSENQKIPDLDSGSGGEAPGPPPDGKVGYCKPPVEHQFKKGQSGNSRGRPRKNERALTRRQVRRDVLRVGETPTVIRTDKGTKTVTAFEAILLRATNKALSGHGPSIRLVIKLYSEAIAEHNEVHDREFSKLEIDEQIFTLYPEFDNNDAEVVAHRKRFFTRLNGWRKNTHRT